MSLIELETQITSFLNNISEKCYNYQVCGKTAEYLLICSEEITPHAQSFCSHCAIISIMSCGKDPELQDDILVLDKTGQQSSGPTFLQRAPPDRYQEVDTSGWKDLLGREDSLQASRCGWDTRVDSPQELRNFTVEQVGGQLVARGYRYNEWCLRGLGAEEKERARRYGFVV